MDFKTRFQGKTSHITSNGGIADMVKQSTVPINKVQGNQNSKIIVNNPLAHQQLISYGSGFADGSGNFSNGRGSNNNTYYNEENYNPNNDSPMS
jgi:hypothetical protein